MVCDSLIDVWLAETGQPREYFNPVDWWCYVGKRGMGALEYSPTLRDERRNEVKIAQLADTIDKVFDDRSSL